MDRDSAAGFGIGLAVGAIIGLTVGLLYAPRPGTETRQIIRDKAEAVIEKAKEKVARFRGKSDAEEIVE